MFRCLCKLKGIFLASDLFGKAKTNTQQEALNKNLANMIPYSFAFVVLFQGAEKSLKVRLDPTCQQQRT